METSILIKGGTVLDGTRTPMRAADLLVQNGRISAVAPGLSPQADRVIDASGHYVAPGFIDIHSHSDFSYLDCPSAESKVRQGVTTEVVGNCGFSPAPIEPAHRDLLKRTADFLPNTMPFDWQRFGQFLDRLRGAGLSINVAPFVGHGALRIAAMGFERRPPLPHEQAQMERLAEEAMDDGAFGVSTGLIYPPGAFSETRELVALSRVVARRRGLYFSHIRGEGLTLETAIAEAIRIGEEAGLPVQIAHLKAAGRDNWDRMDAAIRLIDQARARGVEVTADIYPYTAGSTTLTNLIPEWVHEGGLETLLGRLADLPTRQRIIEECTLGAGRWRTGTLGTFFWNDVMIASCPSVPPAEGMRLDVLAKKRGRAPADALIDLLLEARGAVAMVLFMIDETNMVKGLTHPHVMVGSDALGLYAGEGPRPGKPHPRAYGTHPRVLGRYVREQRLLSWEEAVHKMTGMCATKLGLRDRGFIREGCAADLMVFDPASVTDRATFEEPHQYPVGIGYVLVNGQVVWDGRMHPLSAGQILTPPH